MSLTLNSPSMTGMPPNELGSVKNDGTNATYSVGNTSAHDAMYDLIGRTHTGFVTPVLRA